jgi:hypothetical protein
MVCSTPCKACTGVSGEGHGARWSMAAIDVSIGGVRNFEWVARTVQCAAINWDPSRRGVWIDGG